jgi:glycosyltransferase involved in cell wall biosynthesis
MRILHVAEVAYGGVTTLVREFSRMQGAEGHEIHALVQPEVPVADATVHTWEPRRRQLWRYPAYRRRLREVVAEVRPDVVHLHSFFPGVFGRLGTLPGRPAVVYQPHCWAFAAAGRGAFLAVAWERRAIRRCDVLVTNCADETAEGEGRGVKVTQNHIIGVPIDVDRFSPGRPGPLPLDAGDGARLIVCPGRISWQKGQDLLAQAWERSPVPGARVALVGEGDSEVVQEWSPSQLGHTVLTPGATDRMEDWLRAADVVVLPSRWEGQSVAMAEALACGTPVVMTRVNGAQEAVAPEGEPAAGVVVEVEDMTALLDACRVRVDDDGLRAEESRAARERATRLFSPDSVGARLMDAYHDALGQHRTEVAPR